MGDILLSAGWNFNFSSLQTSVSWVDFAIPWGRRAQLWTCCNTELFVPLYQLQTRAWGSTKTTKPCWFCYCLAQRDPEDAVSEAGSCSSLIKEYFSFSQGSELASVSLVLTGWPRVKSELAPRRDCSCEKQNSLAQGLLSATLGFVRSLCSSLFICAVPPLHILLSLGLTFSSIYCTASLLHSFSTWFYCWM